jgi:hypothetical protein
VETGRATVARLKTVKGLGVFYLNSHGSPGVANIVTSGGSQAKPVFAVWTATPVVAGDVGFKADLDDGSLVKLRATFDRISGVLTEAEHYGITATFIAKYDWRFGLHSLVYFDTCLGGNAPFFIRACVNRGASVYLGWNRAVGDQHALRATTFFFDRSLGTNKARIPAPIPIGPEKPKQRPFDYAAVLQEMQRRDPPLTVYKPGSPEQADLRPSAGTTGKLSLLAPSIKRLTVDEGNDRLVVRGSFGEDPGDEGSVTIGETRAEVTEWTPQRIACALVRPGRRPQPAAGSAGEVVVTVRGRRSNAVPLTLWRVKMNYAFKRAVGNLAYSLRFDLFLRADVHSYRDEPGRAPRDPVVHFRAAAGTECRFRVGGNAQYEEEFPSIGRIQIKMTWPTRSGTTPLIRDPDVEFPERGFQVRGRIDSGRKLMRIGITVAEEFTAEVIRRYPPNPPLSDSFTESDTLRESMEIERALLDVPANGGVVDLLELPLTQAFELETGSRPKGGGVYRLSDQPEGASIPPSVDWSARLEWQESAPLFPPPGRDEDARP